MRRNNFEKMISSWTKPTSSALKVEHFT
jgi:hypothetical protein